MYKDDEERLSTDKPITKKDSIGDNVIEYEDLSASDSQENNIKVEAEEMEENAIMDDINSERRTLTHNGVSEKDQELIQ